MSISDIRSDTIQPMTSDLYRAFCSLGCEPACHGCDCMLSPGRMFQLASVENEKNTSIDVMLCDKCEPSQDVAERVRPSGQGCFRVGGKVSLHVP